MAAFRCCRCQRVGVQAHHIIPSENGGPDTMDNAAPLCPNCHVDFGDNPLKRKEITQMRDWWYAKVIEIFAPLDGSLLGFLERIDALVNSSELGSEVAGALESELVAYLKHVFRSLGPRNARSLASDVLDMIPLDTGY